MSTNNNNNVNDEARMIEARPSDITPVWHEVQRPANYNPANTSTSSIGVIQTSMMRPNAIQPQAGPSTTNVTIQPGPRQAEIFNSSIQPQAGPSREMFNSSTAENNNAQPQAGPSRQNFSIVENNNPQAGPSSTVSLENNPINDNI